MFCPNCGTNIPEGTKFCPKCGARIDKKGPVQPQQQEPAGAVHGNGTVSKLRRELTPRIIGIIVAAIVVIIAIVVLIVILSNRSSTADYKEDNSIITPENGIPTETSTNITTDKEISESEKNEDKSNGLKFDLDAVINKLVKEAETRQEVPEHSTRNLKLATKYKIDGTVVSETYYYEDGQVWQENEYSSDGNTIDEVLYEYNEFGLTKTVERTVRGERATETARVEYDYDDNGNLIREATWGSETPANSYHLKYVTEHDYDTNNNLLASYRLTGHAFGYTKSVDEFSRDNDPYETFTYDEYGNLLTQKDSDGYVECSYDDNHNLILKKNYNSNISLVSWEEYTYDDNGNELSSVIYNADNSVDSKFEYEYNYDDKRNLLSYTEYFYSANGNLEGQEEYVYDQDGHHVIYTNQNDDGSSYISCYYYDSDENDILRYSYSSDFSTSQTVDIYQTIYWTNGKIYEENCYTYDEYGTESLIRTTTYDFHGNKDDSDYTYTYDEYGNVLTESILENGVRTEYTYTNEYYD